MDTTTVDTADLNENAALDDTIGESDSIEEIDTPDWRGRNALIRGKYIEALARKEEAEKANDPTALAEAESQLDNLGREFFELNQGLARSSARRFTTGAGSAADYQAAASLGLWEAFTRWDPTRGVAFSTFSRQYVNGRIQRAVRQVEFSQLSQSEFALRNHIRRTANKIAEDEQRNATIEEIAGQLGEKTERVLRTLASPAASLETPIGDGNATLADLVAGEQAALDVDDDADYLGGLLDDVSDLEAWVLAARSGAYGGETPSLLEVAGHLGIGREIARRAETRGRLQLARKRISAEQDRPDLSAEELASELSQAQIKVAIAEKGSLSASEAAEITAKWSKHVEKYFHDVTLTDLHHQWTRASEALSLACGRNETREARAKLDAIGRAALDVIAGDAEDASVRYSTADGETLTSEEAAAALFEAFLSWNAGESHWRDHSHEQLSQIGERRRKRGQPEPLDRDNTWNWLRSRHVGA